MNLDAELKPLQRYLMAPRSSLSKGRLAGYPFDSGRAGPLWSEEVPHRGSIHALHPALQNLETFRPANRKQLFPTGLLLARTLFQSCLRLPILLRLHAPKPCRLKPPELRE